VSSRLSFGYKMEFWNSDHQQASYPQLSCPIVTLKRVCNLANRHQLAVRIPLRINHHFEDEPSAMCPKARSDRTLSLNSTRHLPTFLITMVRIALSALAAFHSYPSVSRTGIIHAWSPTDTIACGSDPSAVEVASTKKHFKTPHANLVNTSSASYIYVGYRPSRQLKQRVHVRSPLRVSSCKLAGVSSGAGKSSFQGPVFTLYPNLAATRPFEGSDQRDNDV